MIYSNVRLDHDDEKVLRFGAGFIGEPEIRAVMGDEVWEREKAALDKEDRRGEACDQLLRERARIAAVLADLPASWAGGRKVLNELQAIVGR